MIHIFFLSFMHLKRNLYFIYKLSKDPILLYLFYHKYDLIIIDYLVAFFK